MHLLWFICLMPVTVLNVLALEEMDFAPCPGGTLHGASNSCIIVVHEYRNWSDARAYCQDLYTGGDLIKITSVQMNWAIADILPNDRSWIKFWIGLKLYGVNQRWLDETTNTAYTHAFWFDNDYNNGKHCFVTPIGNSYWRRYRCSSEKKFICQYPYDP
ncbi:hypothetical protein EGW08_018963 [Elysia chlorotica]|uniref:C-type lectin domain-containing protein n=1 Tax=Elysia chlorotica TaxID=188477 RepID=A0A433SVR5_ELYCH|nr:hypothetical protein EGW08_018963 [Elysia chlorotica]